MGVSVVIPNYNGEKYLKKCLDTLMEQTLKPEDIYALKEKIHMNSTS